MKSFISVGILIFISYHIVDLKRQNRLKVGTNKPKLKVKMQSVSDDDVRKRLLEEPRFEVCSYYQSCHNVKHYCLALKLNDDDDDDDDNYLIWRQGWGYS